MNDCQESQRMPSHALVKHLPAMSRYFTINIMLNYWQELEGKVMSCVVEREGSGQERWAHGRVSILFWNTSPPHLISAPKWPRQMLFSTVACWEEKAPDSSLLIQGSDVSHLNVRSSNLPPLTEMLCGNQTPLHPSDGFRHFGNRWLKTAQKDT